MEGQITMEICQQWKADIRQKLNEIAENFIFIGYRLRQIEESEAYRQDGYQSLDEFARVEFNLSSSTVSRMKAINKKFSTGGQGQELLPEFKGIAYSKLQEMLTLSEADCELITENTTVSVIKELKKFNKSNPTIEDVPERHVTPLQECIRDFFADPGRRKLLNEIMQETGKDSFGYAEAEKIAETLNPSGCQSHKKGLVFLFMYDFKTGVAYKLMTKPEPVKMSWMEFIEQIKCLYMEYMDGESDIWCSVYGAAPEEPEELPGQMNLMEYTNQEQPKESTVSRSCEVKEKALSKDSGNTQDKPARQKTDPAGGMTEKEKDILTAAVLYVAGDREGWKEIEVQDITAVSAHILESRLEEPFYVGDSWYLIRVESSRISVMEQKRLLYRWGMTYFSACLRQYLLQEEEEEQTEKPEETEDSSKKLDKNAGCPPESHNCVRQEWGHTEAEQEAGRKECAKCWREWEKRDQLLRKAEETRPETLDREQEPLQDEKSIEVDQEENRSIFATSQTEELPAAGVENNHMGRLQIGAEEIIEEMSGYLREWREKSLSMENMLKLKSNAEKLTMLLEQMILFKEQEDG